MASRQESMVQALERLQRTVEQVLAETGLSEEALSRLYDLNQPLPGAPRQSERDEVSDAHTARRRR